MYAVSTAAFIFILVLASSLAVIVQAGDPRLIKCLHKQPISTGLGGCEELLSVLKTNMHNFVKLNPGQDCNQIIASGQACVDGQFPICKTNVTAGATDTCDTLVTAYQITKAQFIAYNDDVDANDCSGVVAATRYCVAIDPY